MAARTLVAVVALLVGLLQPAAALGQDEHRAATGPLARMYGYATPTLTISKGDKIVYTNLDIELHDFVQDVAADGKGGKPRAPWCKKKKGHHDGHDHGGGCPVFWSEAIGFQASTEVKGLNRVKPGETYTFFCTLHHQMKGTLIVRP